MNSPSPLNERVQRKYFTFRGEYYNKFKSRWLRGGEGRPIGRVFAHKFPPPNYSTQLFHYIIITVAIKQLDGDESSREKF